MDKQISYINITKNTEQQHDKQKQNKQLEKFKSKQSSQWTVLNKSSLNKLKEMKEKKEKKQEENLEKFTLEDWYKLCIKLGNNWDKYRDNQNELLGDRSPYINYKNDIQKIVDEENYIQEEMFKIQNNYYVEYDSDNNSDSEANKGW